VRELRRLAYAVIQLGVAAGDPPGWVRRTLADGLGGVMFWSPPSADAASLAATTAAVRRENPDVLVAMSEAGGADAWPGNAALGVLDPATTRTVVAAMGRDLAAAGIAMKYAPVADVSSNPRNPVIGTRSFGSRAELVAAHTTAYVEGLQGRGVAACAKHFPGHGDTSVDSHLGLPIVHDDIGRLDAGPLRPFRAAVEARVRAVMTAHIRFPTFDHVPATLSRTLLTGVLRGELGYDGLIVTDALEMAALERAYGLEAAAPAAIAAGADALFLGGWQDAPATVARVRDALISAVRSGRLPEQRLAEAAGRVADLVSWSERSRRVDGPPVPAETGVATARRAIHVIGTVTPLRTAPYVLELAPPEGTRGPRTAWGLAWALTRRWPEATGLRMTAPADDPATAAAGRPLVIAVRDAHRHAWVGAVLDAALRSRPDATVVEMGLPTGDVPTCAAYLSTYSATAASSLAVADLLTEPRRP
jgi:beta-N-acetylhexosaminidase